MSSMTMSTGDSPTLDGLLQWIVTTYGFLSAIERRFMRDCLYSMGEDAARAAFWLPATDDLVLSGALQRLAFFNAEVLGEALKSLIEDTLFADNATQQPVLACVREADTGALHVYAGRVRASEIWDPAAALAPPQSVDDIVALYPFLDEAEREMLRYIVTLPVFNHIAQHWVTSDVDHRWHLSERLESSAFKDASHWLASADTNLPELVALTATIRRSPLTGDITIYCHVNRLRQAQTSK